MRRNRFVQMLVVVILAAMPLTASAQFPGTNGKLVYLNLAGDLMSANPDGTGIVTIVGASTLDATTPPVVNKAGTKFTYTNSAGLALANADGTGITQLTSNASDEFPVFSPDGTKIYFDNGGDILSIGVDGTGRTTLLAHTGTRSYQNATASPDGTKLGVVGADSGTSITDLYTVATSGGSATNVTNNASGTNTFVGDYSPDGTKFALITRDTTNTNLTTMPVAGGAQTTLLSLANASNTAYTDPSWSPDGAKLAVLRYTTGVGGGLFSRGTVVTLQANGSGAADVGTLGSQPARAFWSVLGLSVAPALPNAASPASQLPWAFLGLGLLLICGIEVRRRIHRA